MTVRDAAKVLVDQKISGAPVIDAQGSLVGVISEGDLIRRVELDTHEERRSWWLDLFAAEREAEAYVKSHGRTVQDVMTTDVICVNDVTPLREVANTLQTHGIKRVPVMQAGRLVGIVSRANLVQALASEPEQPTPQVPSTDRKIREMLMGELAGRAWASASRNVVVRDGVVHLWGTFRSSEAVQAVRVAAEAIPGVKRVEDHTEPYPVLPGI
jgi:CBS domain-containing protein